MRILAIYFVMFNHTGTNGFFHFAVVETRLQRWTYLAISIGCKFAVPLFFMISGALLLHKEESVSTLFRKRIWKFVCVLILFSRFYWMYYDRDPMVKLSLSAFWKATYTSNVSVALWYLYSYLAMLIMLPLLRKLAKAMRHEDYIYMAVVQLVFTGIIPIADFLMFKGSAGMNGNLRPALFVNSNISFVLMGYYFEHVFPERLKTWKTVLLGVGASILAILICAVMTLYKGRLTGEISEGTSQTFHNTLIAIPTYTIYLASKLFFERVAVPEKLGRFITAVGGTTFGVYLLEGMLRKETLPVYWFLQPRIKTMPACFLWIFCALAAGSLLVWLLKKLPGLNKIL